ncbi:uncharacterized protein EAF01_006591 [Botrytis porri]|uniref:uncharacterized protein n=1 Tax=Botrytis porri TaxID=87229 RepID=UPI0018FFA25D|nr:uncharacterized protein EAF01_006591 [Botrytis porri]KAF7903542.1 hypothetical protein EAF01_006591 [Botrytis porri]
MIGPSNHISGERGFNIEILAEKRKLLPVSITEQSGYLSGPVLRIGLYGYGWNVNWSVVESHIMIVMVVIRARDSSIMSKSAVQIRLDLKTNVVTGYASQHVLQQTSHINLGPSSDSSHGFEN